MVDLSGIDYQKSELVIGLVGAIGTDLSKVQERIKQELKKTFSYDCNIIKLSDLLDNLDLESKLKDSPEFCRVSSRMDAGDEARKKSGLGEFLALMGVSQIYRSRPTEDTSGFIRKPRSQIAHILNQLKHPDEVTLLRLIYGHGFWLIGVYAPEKKRLKRLIRFMNKTEAKKLMERDYLEPEVVLGQRTSDTFHRADVFIREDNLGGLDRIFDLLFSYQFNTPTQDEQAMFIAHAAAMRSASLSRQVGASIVSADGDVISIGVNEVPSYGGGLFWPNSGKKDLRDHTKKKDPSSMHKRRLITDVAKRLGRKVDEVEGLLKDSELRDITEFQRAVHAEMEALLACARSGVNPQGGTLYTTVFPCHICAKHIVAAGIKRVIYIEPYPKSRAVDLLSDFITLDTDSKDKVRFESFVGIGPRRYVDLFSMVAGTGRPLKRMDEDGKVCAWEAKTALLRLPMSPISYIEREGEATKKLKEIMEKKIQEKEENHA